MDLLISEAGKLIAIEIKSGQTFQPEFVKGIDRFQNACNVEKEVCGIVWYDGQRKTQYKGTDVRNPLIHGFEW